MVEHQTPKSRFWVTSQPPDTHGYHGGGGVSFRKDPGQLEFGSCVSMLLIWLCFIFECKICHDGFRIKEKLDKECSCIVPTPTTYAPKIT